MNSFIDIEQLDRLTVFFMGILWSWLIRIIFKKVVPDIKDDLKMLISNKVEDK